MKLLIYATAFAPSVGGVETYVMLLAQGLARRFSQTVSSDLQVTVVTRTQAGDSDDAALPFQVVRQPSLVPLIKLLVWADVIHMAGPSFLPLLFGLLFGKRVVVEHSGYQACCPNGLLFDERTKTACPGLFMAGHYRECVGCNTVNVGWSKSLTMVLLTFPRRWLCCRVARNVGPSVHVGRRVALPRMVTIRHGVPKLSASPGNGRLSKPICFAYIGRLVWEKGVPILLGAARELMARGYDFRLKVVGDGPDRPRLEEMTDLYGLRTRTTFTGYLQGDALLKGLEEISVTVMPSIWEDVAPVAAIEHMMQERLLIASDIGGLGELIDDVGLKFAPGDTAGLASCMKRVLDKPWLANELGQKARQRALQLFLEERMVAEHLALYQELMTGSVTSLHYDSAI